ncbi:substrate-binding periplasmic protein [Aurantibacillus circumpalustris]|uniref:substrate-binding periplasmic protein n=1 Tax=Aurantibacillus circumpalustris TaxID=3036359 RepID=UPI00295A889E|nr:transporter substrate-binding domain-containing protein [Aurantibacillus circumpalustris]
MFKSKIKYNHFKFKFLFIILVAVSALSICLSPSLFSNQSNNYFKNDSSYLFKQRKLCLIDTTSENKVMNYIYNAPESEKDERYGYHWEILKTALEKTKKKYGLYKMTRAKFMTERRQLHEIKKGSKEINIMYLGTTQELERDLLPIRIPVDKNLGGYCVMLIRKEDQEKINRIKTLEDFRKLSIGLGYGWIDVSILEHNKFNVVTGSSYEGLFKMLANKRFDVFSRSAVEIIDEFNLRSKEFKNLKIEDSLLLYYPLPMYFWFSKNEKGLKLKKRAEEGMRMMIKDGSYDSIFNRYHGKKTQILNLRKRKIFKVENPFLVAETPFSDLSLWYNPISRK